MESSGVGLKPELREKFNKLQLEAAELSTKFSNNVLDSTKLFKLELTDPADVEGLPLSAKALAAQTANGKTTFYVLIKFTYHFKRKLHGVIYIL